LQLRASKAVATANAQMVKPATPSTASVRLALWRVTISTRN
jgi:hypothetical protein